MDRTISTGCAGSVPPGVPPGSDASPSASAGAPPISIDQFGLLHWLAFQHAITSCLNMGGIPDNLRLSYNSNRRGEGGHPWPLHWGVQLHDRSFVSGVDDCDCLDDCERAGLIEIVEKLGGRPAKIKATVRGMEVYDQMKNHCRRGHKLELFTPVDGAATNLEPEQTFIRAKKPTKKPTKQAKLVEKYNQSMSAGGIDKKPFSE